MDLGYRLALATLELLYGAEHELTRLMLRSAESPQHRDAFKATPEKYAPQYGAYCSWGVAQDKLFDVDPVSAWKIVDGKLYLNFTGDIQATWEKDIAGFIAKAEKNWPGLNR